MQIKSAWAGPVEIVLAAGHIAHVFKDRRVATAQRRARGLGTGNNTRRENQYERGRRILDRVAHIERRMLSSKLIPLRRRRIGDERRKKFWTYASSPDLRIRALERRSSEPTMAFEIVFVSPPCQALAPKTGDRRTYPCDVAKAYAAGNRREGARNDRRSGNDRRHWDSASIGKYLADNGIGRRRNQRRKT